MTEAEWLACDDPEQMLKFVSSLLSSRRTGPLCWEVHGARARRSFRLFACACCRQAWDELNAPSRLAVESAEGFGEGPGLAAPKRIQGPWFAGLVREIFGNPFRPSSLETAWRTPIALSLTLAAYEERHLPSGY